MDYSVHLVVDGSFLLHLSIPYNPAERVGPHIASYNFFRSLAQWSVKLKAAKITVCWDGGTPAARKAAVPAYKENRKALVKDKDRERFHDFGRNKEFLEALCPSLAVRSIQADGLEADDLVFGVCNAETQYRVVILSGDMDLAQLVSYRVDFFRPGKDRISLGNFSSLILDENYDIRPRDPSDLVAFKALRGDSSDNIKAVVKPKALCRIWERLKSENLPASVDNVRKLATNLDIDISDQYERNLIAVDLRRSGVAGDAIAYATGALSRPVAASDAEIYQKFLEVQIQSGYLHASIPTFHYLR